MFEFLFSGFSLFKNAAAFVVAEAKRRRADRDWHPIRKTVESKMAVAIGTFYVRGVANCGLPPEGVFDGWPRHLREIHSRIKLRDDYELRVRDLRHEADARIVLAATCVGLRFAPELCADLTRLSGLDGEARADTELRRRLTRVLLSCEDVRKGLKALDQSLDEREFAIRAATNAGVMAGFFEVVNELLFWTRRHLVELPPKRRGLLE